MHYNMVSEKGLKYLFLKFLKIGSIAFGGFMSLISIVQREMVEKDKTVDNNTILDGISIASVLPGPMAVNVITFLGYRLKGFRGGLISMLAVSLPSFILILVLSMIYFRYGHVSELNKFFEGVLPAVAAIILSVSIGMTKKNIREYRQYLLAVIAFLLVYLVGGFFITLIIVVSGGISGRILFYKPANGDALQVPGKNIWKEFRKEFVRYRIHLIVVLLVLLALYFLPLLFKDYIPEKLLEMHALLFTIGGVSITLFGGGYVFIPMLQELVVDKLHWLTSKEFIDGIALGQVTPGPIMISATFIGYKVAGIMGAMIATIAIFLPPGILIIMCARFMDFFKHSPLLKAVFKGIHPVVIGMIYAACLIIVMSMPHEILHFSIFVLSFLMVFIVKVDLLIIIPVAGLAGLFLS